MATTLKITSFAESNIRERSALAAPVITGDSIISVESTAGYAADDIIYLGALSREGCERVVVASVDSAEQLTLTAPVTLDHPQFDAVTSVVGDRVRIYRALDIDGNVPADELFSVLATRSIDADQVLTHYTDSSGSSSYWYRSTYYNEATTAETSLSDSQPVRGDDFGHYASLSEIRREAGFENATNLSDVIVDQKRRAAETEVNTELGGVYQVPFIKPIPEAIRSVTISLAAGLLKQYAYPGSSAGDKAVKDARATLAQLKLKTSGLPDDEVTALTSGISSWPDDTGDRMFSVDDRY